MSTEAKKIQKKKHEARFARFDIHQSYSKPALKTPCDLVIIPQRLMR